MARFGSLRIGLEGTLSVVKKGGDGAAVSIRDVLKSLFLVTIAQ